jgi:ATP-dependent Clp protease ATP-binding subunit ClpC
MRRALELAMHTAGELHDTYLGTEHILLGLIREQEGVAAKALANLGVTWEATLAKTIETENRVEDVPSVPPAPQAQSEMSRTLSLLRIAEHLLGKNGERDAARALGEAIARLERRDQQT